jgi:cation transport regulator ChaC
VIALLAYGSLMHPAELARHCTGTRSVPVRVQGFRRSFSQEPSWRNGEGAERGVLTVRRSASDWLNAILVSGSRTDALRDVDCGSGDGALRSIDQRERGYTRVVVPLADVEPYATHEIDPLITEIGLYIGRDEKWNDELMPNRAYLKLCIEAAGLWGSEFAGDFLRTTYSGSITIEDFVRSIS